MRHLCHTLFFFFNFSRGSTSTHLHLSSLRPPFFFGAFHDRMATSPESIDSWLEDCCESEEEERAGNKSVDVWDVAIGDEEIVFDPSSFNGTPRVLSCFADCSDDFSPEVVDQQIPKVTAAAAAVDDVMSVTQQMDDLLSRPPSYPIARKEPRRRPRRRCLSTSSIPPSPIRRRPRKMSVPSPSTPTAEQIKKSSPKKGASHVCEICFAEFSFHHHLTNHQYRHGPPGFVCSYCDDAFYTSSARINHTKNSHKDELLSYGNAFQCDHCHLLFMGGRMSKKYLNHLARFHSS